MKRAIFLFALIILALFTMANVCAIDANDTAMASEDNGALELGDETNDAVVLTAESSAVENIGEEGPVQTNTWYVNSSSPYNEGSQERPFSNMEDAIANSSDGDTIMIASGNYAGGKNIGLTINQAGLTLMKYGDGEAIFDAQQDGRILNVNSNSIIISGLTFQNGKAFFGNGGAIYFYNDLRDSRIDATFINNHASKNGGAMYFGGELTNVSIRGHYENNTVLLNGAANCFLKTLVNVTISGDYINNAADAGMGGANFFEENLTDVKLIGDYESNHAGIEGGANCFMNVLNRVEIIGNYTNNSGSYGGANVFDGAVANVNITGNYNGNYAKEFSIISIVDGKGGAIYFQKALANVKISGEYDSNNASKYGGAIYFDGDGVVSDCVFANNFAGDGGAIYFNSGDCTVSNSVFVNNSANNFAAVHLPFGESNVLGCVFINNSAVNGVVGSGWNSFKSVNIENSIFLCNNVSGDVIDFAYFENLTTDYNWFGNTADDYNATVPSQSSGIWLFLNATAHPDVIAVLGSSNIVFELYAYNKTSRNVSVYDNSFIKPVNLTITQIKGKVANDTVNLGGTVKYNATDGGKGSVTAAMENVAYTIELTIKFNPDLSLGNQKAIYSANTIIALDYNASASGKVNITLKGKKFNYSFADRDLNASISLGDIGSDVYDVTVAYSGDGEFINSTATGTLTVDKADSTLTVKGMAFYYGASGSTTVSFTGASGVKAKVVNNLKAVVKVNKNKITVSGLDAGTYTLSVTTVTDSNHKAVTKTAKITVKKLKIKIAAKALTATYNINKNLLITLKDVKNRPLNGLKLTVNLNGAKTLKTDKKGQVKVSTKGLAPKKYTVKITFKGNVNYLKSTKSVKVLVKKAKPRVVVKAKTYTSNTKIKECAVVLKDNIGKVIKNAKLTLKVDGKVYKATTDNTGKATFKITQLTNEGTYIGVITYNGDKYYSKLNKNVKITVKPAPVVKPTFQTVSEGSSDTAMVEKIQVALKDHGYYLTYDGYYLMVDGYYGSCTARSVGEFQYDNGLPATGEVDEATARKLGII